MRPTLATQNFTFSRTLLMQLYLIYGLCMDSDVFVRLFGGVAVNSGQASFIHSGSSNPVLFALTTFFMIWSLGMALPIYKEVLRILFSVPWFTAIYVESVVSILWSIDSTASFRYGLTLWTYMFCGLLSSIYLSTRQIARLLGNSVFVLGVLSVPSQFYFPHDTIVPGWAGIYGEKNHLGIGMTIGLVALFVQQERWTAFRIFQAVFMCCLLALSQSGTAMVSAIAFALLLFYLRSGIKLRRLVAAATGGLLFLGWVLIPHFLDRVLGVAGKNTTLTGRDVIWSLSVREWAKRPILGWGYSAFWGAEDALIQQNLGWNPGHSHNGFLEVGLALGIVGVVIILGILFTGFALAFRVRRNVSELAGTWLLCSLTVLLLHDMTEVDFLLPAPLWFIFTAVFFAAKRDLDEQTGVTRSKPLLWRQMRQLPQEAGRPLSAA